MIQLNRVMTDLFELPGALARSLALTLSSRLANETIDSRVELIVCRGKQDPFREIACRMLGRDALRHFFLRPAKLEQPGHIFFDVHPRINC